ncbi:retrovirus-related pol polyprotein from transposon TNT 1-94 [Tanacetum coccineum]
MYHKKNVDYAYLLWKDFVYQVENKNVKRSNEMYYPRFTKVIVNFFVTKDSSIPRRNRLYGAILPDELTNEAIKDFESYKEYYAIASGAEPPKTKASVKKKQAGSDKTKTPPTAKGKRLKTSVKAAKPAKKKQPAKTSKAKGLSILSDVALTEAEQMKLATKRSLIQTHSSHASGSSEDEGTCENDDDDNDDVDDDADNQDDEGQDDDNEKTDSDKDGDEFVHLKLSTHDQEERQDEKDNEEEGSDLRVQTPSHYESTGDEESDEVTHGANVEEEELDKEETNEEDEVNELYKDVNVNLEGRDTEMIDALCIRFTVLASISLPDTSKQATSLIVLLLIERCSGNITRIMRRTLKIILIFTVCERQEIFQRDNSVLNQSALSFDQLFELNELKAQSQEKDTVIKKLKERIKSLSGKMNEDNIKKDLEETETINIELDHRSVEISDLNASLQEKVLVITALKDDLRKLKGKALVDNDVTKHTIDPEMLKIDVEPITPKLLNKRTAHSAYIKHTQEEAAVLRDLVDHVKANYPLDHSLESACRYTKLIQELLTNISKTCPSINNSGEKLVAVTPKNKDKRVRFTEPVTSSGNTITKIASTSNLVSNKPMLSSTGVKPSTSASGSQPSGNTKKDKIQQTPSSTQKNKVEAHPRKVKSSLKNKDCVVAPKGTANVQHSKLNANSELKCVKCNGCMLSDNHDLCVLDFINNVNARVKSKSVKKSSKGKVWKPTGKVFTNIGYIWRPTGRTFTIVGNVCPLTRITTTTKVPLRKPTALENETPKPVVTLVYSRKPRKSKTNVPVSKSKIGNVTISRYGDYQHWEFAFRQHTCFIRNLEGVDLLTGSRGNNLYTLSLGDIMASSPICLLSKALKNKSWLWHQRLSHLNFGAINYLARHDLVRGLPKLKFEKDHLCSACAMGKSKKKPYKPKSEDTNQEKLYLLHMDLCGPMRVTSVDGKKTDNGTEFVNHTLREYSEKVGISHETSVTRSTQQNGVIKRRNRTLIKVARTMLIYAKDPLFLWAEAVATAYFDKLSAMASEHSSSRPALHEMTPATISSGLVPNPSSFNTVCTTFKK